MEAAAKEVASLEKKSVCLNQRTRFFLGLGILAQAIPRWQNHQVQGSLGNLEEGEPETFAPVVACSSVRLFLVVFPTLGWQTAQLTSAVPLSKTT
jgi:hypothetical protein